MELKPHAKFRKPTITPSGRKVTQAEEERKKERKNAANSDSTRKLLGPITKEENLGYS